MDKGLMEENGTYGASGVLFNGGKCYLKYFGCFVGLFVKGRVGFFSKEVGIGMVVRLCVWVEMWE